MEKNQNENKIQPQRGKGRYYFLTAMLLIYAGAYLFEPQKTLKSLEISGHLFVDLIPVLIFVWLIMALINYFLKPQKVKKLMGKESGWKGWLLAIILGIISHGSVYAWYPLLKDLKNHGMREGLIAGFIYSRAIKIPFIPLMIYYFGLKFFIVLTIYMIIGAILEGLLLEKI
ncbi:MAG TPA: permease [Caldithrix abyssi]|uniref:Permease n=1 Tax=Caldithrix abyssi TaxID=187145 RepID=A0A7V5H4J4_CALAY|nr:permease [Caldisericaceae bacterium]HHE54333.1 permease [Caldithrix abyssi]